MISSTMKKILTADLHFYRHAEVNGFTATRCLMWSFFMNHRISIAGFSYTQPTTVAQAPQTP